MAEEKVHVKHTERLLGENSDETYINTDWITASTVAAMVKDLHELL